MLLPMCRDMKLLGMMIIRMLIRLQYSQDVQFIWIRNLTVLCGIESSAIFVGNYFDTLSHYERSGFDNRPYRNRLAERQAKRQSRIENKDDD